MSPSVQGDAKASIEVGDGRSGVGGCPLRTEQRGMPVNVMHDILEQARWAPSGDNTQPWRFEIVSDRHVRVHAFDTRHHCVYDLDGRASQLSVGALLETMRIAATRHGLETRVEPQADLPEETARIDVHFAPSDRIGPDPLLGAIRVRSVQRKPLSTRPLTPEAKAKLESAVKPDHEVVWFEERRDRIRMAWLAVRSAKIRLTIPEAYKVHRDIIHWGQQFSDDRVPDQALGADAMTVKLMRWTLATWERVSFMNRWLGGTYLPRLQLDFVPGVRCAAHFAIVARSAPDGAAAQWAAGKAVQRFWLTATSQGLQLQPQYTPLVFSRYARDRLDFTSSKPALERASAIRTALAAILGEARVDRTVFLGRVGKGPAPVARSLRLPLEKLFVTESRVHRPQQVGSG